MKTSASGLRRWFNRQEYRNLSRVLVQGAETIRAHVDLLLATLIDKRSFVDVRHEPPIGCILGVADIVTVERSLAANPASLCHLKQLPFQISAEPNGHDNTTND